MAGVTKVPAMPLSPERQVHLEPRRRAERPVSIIISTSDQQVVILRNGVEIGRAHAVVARQTDQPQVMTLTGGKVPQWIQVGVGSLTGEPAEIISTERVEQMHLPDEFVAKMRSVIQPGTTVLVTQASVDSNSTGLQTTVMDTEDTSNGRPHVGPTTGTEIWGGRLHARSELMLRIDASIGFDKAAVARGYRGLQGASGDVREQGIIPAEDAPAILEGLDQIAIEFERDGVPEDGELEDIHMTVEHRLAALIGPAAGGCTPRARATTRSRPISGCRVRDGCDEPELRSANLQRVLVDARATSMPRRSCRASRIPGRRSR